MFFIRCHSFLITFVSQDSNDDLSPAIAGSDQLIQVDPDADEINLGTAALRRKLQQALARTVLLTNSIPGTIDHFKLVVFPWSVMSDAICFSLVVMNGTMPKGCGIPFSDSMKIVHKNSAYAYYNYFQLQLNNTHLMVVLNRRDMFSLTNSLHLHPWADFANAPAHNAIFHGITSEQHRFYEEHFLTPNSHIRLLREPDAAPKALLITTEDIPPTAEVLHDYFYIDDPDQRSKIFRHDRTSIGFDSWSPDEQVTFLSRRLDHDGDRFSHFDLVMLFIDLVKLDMCRLDDWTSLVINHYLLDVNRHMRGLFLNGEELLVTPAWNHLRFDPHYGPWFQALRLLTLELSEYIVAHRHLIPNHAVGGIHWEVLEDVFENAYTNIWWGFYRVAVIHDRDRLGLHHECRFFNGRVTLDRMLERPFSI